MKTKWMLTIGACVAAVFPIIADEPTSPAETHGSNFQDRLPVVLSRSPDANTAFERGLLEEEANHQFEAAIQNYQVAVDSSGNVYVSDTHHDRIQKFTARGEFLMRWGSTGTNAGSFDYPQGLAVDGNGYLYVADTHNHRIQKFSGGGIFVTQWGKLG